MFDIFNNLKRFSFFLLNIDTEVNSKEFCEPIIIILYKKKMGGCGIVLFFKQRLKDYISIEIMCSGTYMWVKLDKLAMVYCTDVFLCFSPQILLGTMNVMTPCKAIRNN